MTVGDLICVVKDRWLLWFSWDFLISNSRLFISYAYFLAWRMKSLFIGFKLEIWRPLELCFSFPCASEGKEFAWISKDPGAIPGLRRSPPEKGLTTHSSILDWRIPCTGELGGLQSMGLQRVGHDWPFSSLFLSWKSLLLLQAVREAEVFK